MNSLIILEQHPQIIGKGHPEVTLAMSVLPVLRIVPALSLPQL